MNRRIFYIAANTFREAVRDRVLYNLIAFALLLSGAAVLVGQISIEIERLVASLTSLCVEGRIPLQCPRLAELNEVPKEATNPCLKCGMRL